MSRISESLIAACTFPGPETGKFYKASKSVAVDFENIIFRLFLKLNTTEGVLFNFLENYKFWNFPLAAPKGVMIRNGMHNGEMLT